MILRHLLLLSSFATLVCATTVEPPSFPQLVSEADSIYRGHVTSIASRRLVRADGGSVIKTYVTFAIDRPLKGTAQKEIVLEFLGGTVGDDTMEVEGMPRFALGDREILFVQKNGTQICPLVRMMHGRYRIERDVRTGRDYVARENRAPLTDVADVARSMNDGTAAVAAAAIAQALSPGDFEARVIGELQRTAGSAESR